MNTYIYREISLKEFSPLSGGRYSNKDISLSSGNYKLEKRENPIAKSACSWYFVEDSNIGAGIEYWMKLEKEGLITLSPNIIKVAFGKTNHFFKGILKKCALL